MWGPLTRCAGVEPLQAGFEPRPGVVVPPIALAGSPSLVVALYRKDDLAHGVYERRGKGAQEPLKALRLELAAQGRRGYLVVGRVPGRRRVPEANGRGPDLTPRLSNCSRQAVGVTAHEELIRVLPE